MVVLRGNGRYRTAGGTGAASVTGLIVELRLIDAGKRRAKGNRLRFAAILTAAALYRTVRQTRFPESEYQIPCPGVAQREQRFGASLRARVAEAAFVMLEVNARITARAALQYGVFTRFDTGIATGAMRQKIRFIHAPRWTYPAVGFAPATGQYASAGEINHGIALP
jgi:hypothetical protein